MWNDFINELTPKMWELVAMSTLETLYMGFVATALAVLVGMPIGFIAFLTGKGEILEHKGLHQVLDVIINIGRSVPFIILLVVLLPFPFIGGNYTWNNGCNRAVKCFCDSVFCTFNLKCTFGNPKRFDGSGKIDGGNKLASGFKILFA